MRPTIKDIPSVTITNSRGTFTFQTKEEPWGEVGVVPRDDLTYSDLLDAHDELCRAEQRYWESVCEADVRGAA